MAVLGRLPFHIHILVELPASLNFFFNPSDQLPSPAPQAHTIIKQYAVLLLVSNLIALIFVVRPLDRTSRNVAGALAVYHLAPLVRALGRIGRGDLGGGLGGPVVHAVVHGVALFGLFGLWWGKHRRR